MKWQPVNKVACACGKATCAKCVRVEYADGIGSDTLWYTREDGREEMMYLPDGHALCRQVPDSEAASVPVEIIRKMIQWHEEGANKQELQEASVVRAWLDKLRGGE